ncbi:MAG: hypothetical protein LBV68_04695 [Spirochaetaceae bacterium]|jgi:hypothetical protein|nr:hypothetical protein [Spirochaetaceae bacterium]
MRNKIPVLWLIIPVSVLSACASRYDFAVGVSDLLKQYYGLYPSIELDLALVIDSEADDIKAAGVDKYFEPGNSLREKLEPHTIFFSDEDIKTIQIVPEDDHWYKWFKKKPTQFLLIVSLPPEASPPSPDPRMVLLPMEAQFTIQSMFFQVEPTKLNKVNVKPKGPKPK